MEELQEADVLWPDTPPPPAPPWGDREGYQQPELFEATAALGFSGELFGSEHAASSASSTSSSSSSPPSGRGSSDGFLSDPSTFAGGHGGDDASFQEADVLWPDDGYAARERELWWLCCGLADAAATGSRAEPAARGKRGSWSASLVSSPIDIPTGVAARRRRPTAVPVHRGSMGMGGLGQAHW